VLLALAGVALALWFFTANDGATTSAPAATAPGVASREPTPHPADVRRGDVVIAVRAPSDVAVAQRLAREVAGGPATPALRATGQAVLVDGPEPRSGSGVAEPECEDAAHRPVACPTIAAVAYAQGRIFTTTSATDPALRGFVEYWLGRASG
jgi:hypothetical protein